MHPKIRCKCGQILLAPQNHAGAQARCPRCQAPFRVPWLLVCRCGRRLLTPRRPQSQVACPDCGKPMATTGDAAVRRAPQTRPATQVARGIAPARPAAPQAPPPPPPAYAAAAAPSPEPPPPAIPLPPAAVAAPEAAATSAPGTPPAPEREQRAEASAGEPLPVGAPPRRPRWGRVAVAAVLAGAVVAGAFAFRSARQGRPTDAMAPATTPDAQTAVSDADSSSAPQSSTYLPPPAPSAAAPPPPPTPAAYTKPRGRPATPAADVTPPSATAPQAPRDRSPLPPAPAALRLDAGKSHTPRQRQPDHTAAVTPAAGRPERPTAEPPPTGLPAPRVGALAPEIAVSRWWCGRGRDAVNAYRDDYLVLHFLAPTCDACAKTVLALNDLQARFQKENVHVLGIARVKDREVAWRIPRSAGGGRAILTGDTPVAMSAFIRAARPRYPIAQDRDGASMSNYHVRPRTTEWQMASSGAVVWRGHTVRGDHAETCFLIGRNGAIIWAGDGGDDVLFKTIRERINADREKKRRYDAWLEQRVSQRKAHDKGRPH